MSHTVRGRLAPFTGLFYDRPVPETIQRFARMGFRRVAFYCPQSELTDREDNVRAVLDRCQMTAESLHSGALASASSAADDLAAARRHVQWCANVGVPVVTVHAGNSEHLGEAAHTTDLTDAVRALLPSLRRNRVRLALENVHSGFGCAAIVEVCRATEPEWVGLCVDVGHAAVFGRDPAAEIRIAGTHLLSLHLHDNLGERLSNGRILIDADRHLAPGEGVLDWPAIVAALADVRYQGPLALELSGRVHHRAGRAGQLGFGDYLPVPDREEILCRAVERLAAVCDAGEG